MSDGRWFDVDADVLNSVTHFNQAEALVVAGGFDLPGIEGYRAKMALMHSMQSGYTAAEVALLRILDVLHEDHPSGPQWHEALLRRLASPMGGDMARPALLPEGLFKALDETRRFRHVAVHSYDTFKIEEFESARKAAATVAAEFAPAVAAFKRLLGD